MFIKRFFPTKGRQRGDTIVEVLISITVVGMVLGGAYVTANKSLIATRSSQERSNALKLAEAQVEQIKGLSNTNPNALFTAASPFCIYNQTTVLPTSDGRCTQNTTGATATSEPKFHLSISRSGNDFTIRNSWYNAGGTNDHLQIIYRVYQ